MRDHLQYDEFAALSAGGHLSRQENDELQAHLSACAECRQSVEAYRDLVCAGLPLTRDAATAASERATDTPNEGARERFLARASREGVRFSPDVALPAAPVRWPLSYRLTTGLAIAATTVLIVYAASASRNAGPGPDTAREVDRLTHENAALIEQMASRDRELATREEQLRALRSQLASAVPAGDSPPRDQGPGLQLGQSRSQEARLLEEIQNRDRQLAAAAEEISRVNQLRVTDRAALDAQGARLREAFDQLRIATATIDMERQLAAAGRDLLQLMMAKQLRVVDVRDTDPNGRPSPAFARVFIADGATIRIFAFDLNATGAAGGRRFQVWGEQLGKAGSARSLGTLDVDDRSQNRWSLTVQNPDAVKGINSVFVTTSDRENVPDSQRLLYAFLG